MLTQNDRGEAALEFYDKRRRWVEYIATHSAVSDRAFRVGYWLSQRMNGEDQCCWYSKGRVAKEMGRSIRYVQYALAELKAANVLLSIEEKGKVNTYFIHAPFF